MTFGHPKMLWLLAATLPLLTLFFVWSWRRRRFLVSQFVRSRLLAHLTVGLSQTVQKARMVLLVLAVGFLVLTLAQPQWGFAWEEVKQRGLDIVVAVDTSRSMLAEDIAPNRLQRAKLAILDLMRLAKRDRLGLVAFAGTAFLQCPLTLDDEAFRQSVNQIEVGIIPQGGTALAEAIQTAQSAFKDETDNHRVIVLFTDGEDHDSGAEAAADKAAENGVRIFTVGVGTPNGEVLRVRDEQGTPSYLKDAEGNVIKSRLNQSLLTQIATKAHGFYLPLSGGNTMDVLYQRGLAPLPKATNASKLIKQFHERYQWPLGLAMLLLITELLLPDRRKIRRTESIVMATNPELRKMVAATVLVLLSLRVSASPSAALKKYEDGQYRDAYQEYSRLLQRKPGDVRLQFNAGAAAYQAKKFDDAIRHFSAAATAPDLNLQEHAYYNLGNSLYRLGEGESQPEKQTEFWEQSLRQFDDALKLDPKDADARNNLEFVKKKLEELKKQQQQKQQSKDQNKKQDKDQQQDQQKQDQQQQQQQQDKKQDDQQEQNQQKQDQQQKQSDSDKQQQPKPSPDQKQDEQKQPQSQPSQDKQQEKDQEQSSAGQKDQQNANAQTNGVNQAATALGQMTPEQVQQLLDSQKNNEKMMIFIPQDKLRKLPPRSFKDW